MSETESSFSPEQRAAAYYVFSQYLDLRNFALEIADENKREPLIHDRAKRLSEESERITETIGALARAGNFSLAYQWAEKRVDPADWDERARETLGLNESMQAAQEALDNANRYFDMTENVYPKALKLSGEFGRLALGFAELLPITTRHITILDDISHGMTKGEALAKAGIKSFKMSEIAEALGVETLNQAIIKAYELGLLPAYKDNLEIDEIGKSLKTVWIALMAAYLKKR